MTTVDKIAIVNWGAIPAHIGLGVAAKGPIGYSTAETDDNPGNVG